VGAKALEGVSVPYVPFYRGKFLERWRWTQRRSLTVSLALAAGLVLAGLAIGLWPRRPPPITPQPPAQIKTMAVLPFKPLVADSRNESLEMGIADTLIFKLSGIKGIVVRPISAVRKYADLNQDPLAAGREQQVEAVLDASIQVVGERIRVTARLVRVADGSVLWTDRYDQQYADLFAVQDAIAEKLAGSLALKLTYEEKQRLTKRYTENPEAYQLYQWGRFYFIRRTPGGYNYNKGIEYFQQAIEKDPGLALAHVGLADCYTGLGAWQVLPANESIPKARAAAERALKIDDSLAEAHTSLARVKTLSGDWPGAEAEYKRAIELNPNYETAHHWYALHLAGEGRLDEAMAEMRRAQEIDPRSLIINTEVGRIFYHMRQYDQAIAQYQKTLGMDPNFAQAHLQLGWAYEKKGMYQEAIAEYQKAIALGARPTMLSRIGRTYALWGKRGEAQKVLDELKQLSKRSYVPSYDFALIYAGLGEKEQAITWLEKAYEEDPPMGLKVDPTWDSLRSHPRFQDLLRRMGLAP
jgi:serine/threonine-protein kinase